jgi:hypothetical protein
LFSYNFRKLYEEFHDVRDDNSPWTTNKLGICVINKDFEFEWNKRLKILSNTIDYYLDPINKIDKTIEIKNLFFNS